MKKKVFLKRLNHRGKLRIGIFFGYDEKLIAAVKALGNVTCSQTNTCFYLDDTKDLKNENGLDIRYIQELPGHKSSKTTEIYTHVSRWNLVAVRSPIEDLEVS